MLTPDGQAWLLELIRDGSNQPVIRVRQDENISAEVPVDDGFPIIEEGEVIFQASFGADSANFDWTGFEVVIGGRVVDATTEDLGTKVAGSEWKLKPRVSFAALAPSGE